MTEPPDVLYICVNYRTADLLHRGLESIFSSATLAPVAGIVLDNSESDAEWERVQQVVSAFPTVSAIRSEHNGGFGYGVNAAVNSYVQQHASPPNFVWLINPDVWVSPDTLECLISDTISSSLDISSPLIEAASGESWYAGGALDFRRGFTKHFTDKPDELVVQCTFVTGAALLSSWDAWVTLNGMREDLFLYWEDADFCDRALRHGFRLGCVTRSRALHLVGASSSPGGGAKSPLYFRYMARNRVIVCAQYSSAMNIVGGRGLRFTIRLLREAGRQSTHRSRCLFEVAKGSVLGFFKAIA